MRTMIAVLLALVCCACTSANSAPPTPPRTMTGSPVRPTSPPTPPPTVPPIGGHGSVTARWDPNLNWANGRHRVTHGSAALARRLERDIEAAKPFPRGEFACPIDLAVATHLTLRVAGTVRTAVARLTGCATVRLTGHRAKFIDTAVRRDLALIAPKRWQQYL